MQICITKLTIIGWYYGLMPCRHQAIIWTNSGILLDISFIRSHVTYNSGTIWKIDWTPRNKLQWNINQNSYIFIQENPFENVVWKMVAIFSWPQCVMNTGVYTSIHTWSGMLLLESSHMSLLIKNQVSCPYMVLRKISGTQKYLKIITSGMHNDMQGIISPWPRINSTVYHWECCTKQWPDISKDMWSGITC